jgi:uncharacterized phage-like protein YoqJ
MILTVTGHRPDKLGGYGLGIYNNLVELAQREIALLAPEQVITGMAQGWDQAVAQACRNLTIPYVAAIPFKGQELRWPVGGRKRYYELVNYASEVVYVCQPGYHSAKMQRRNEWMVARCDQIMALWDGTSGGTANCLSFADELSIPITNLWQKWLRIKHNQPQGDDL